MVLGKCRWRIRNRTIKINNSFEIFFFLKNHSKKLRKKKRIRKRNGKYLGKTWMRRDYWWIMVHSFNHDRYQQQYSTRKFIILYMGNAPEDLEISTKVKTSEINFRWPSLTNFESKGFVIVYSHREICGFDFNHLESGGLILITIFGFFFYL